MELTDFVPKKLFFTKGVGTHKDKLTSFELALRDAGIARFNLVTVSSILPPHCEIIPKAKGLPMLNDGEVVFVVLSLGSPGAGWRPWELFGRLPILENLIPSRLLVVVWFCLAALIGLGLDAVAQQWRRWFVRPGLMVVALAPTIAYLAPAMPLAAETVAAPRVFEHQAGQVVLPIPAGFSAIQSSLAWQSVTGYSWSMAGGDGPGSDPRFHARDRLAIHALQRVSGSFPSSPLIATSPLSVRASLERWGVTRIVMARGPGLPAYDLPLDPLGAAALVTAATGEAPVRAQQGWVWSFDARHAPSPRRLDVHRCTVAATRGVQAVAACVLAMGSGVERR